MRAIRGFLVLAMMATLFGTGCAYHRTILRQHVNTPPPLVVPIPPMDPIEADMMEGPQNTPNLAPTPGIQGQQPALAQPETVKPITPIYRTAGTEVLYQGQYYQTSEMWTVGKIYNHSPYAISVHMPPEFEVFTDRSHPHFYREVAPFRNDPSKWVHMDVLTLKPGSSENWWIKIPTGRWRLSYDYSIGANDERGVFTITSDLNLVDHTCNGVVLDWYQEVGAHFCDSASNYTQ